VPAAWKFPAQQAVYIACATDTSRRGIADRFGRDFLGRGPYRSRGWLPSARECEIITVPDRADPVIQRGGQM
jgi:hypothetical protein